METFEDFWSYVGRYIGIHDSVTVVMNDDGNEIIEFRDSSGDLISRYNRDTEEVLWKL